MNAATLVQKLWNYCNVLRDDGLSYGDDALEDGANLPAPEVIAREIAEDLRTAVEQFEALADDLKS